MDDIKMYSVPGIIDTENWIPESKKFVETKGSLLFWWEGYAFFSEDDGNLICNVDIDQCLHWTFKDNGAPLYYSIEFFEPNNGLHDNYSKAPSLYLGDISEEQKQYIINACDEINVENERIYILKVPIENKMIEIVKAEHYTELVNFITKKTNNLLLRYNCLWFVYDTAYDTHEFHRKSIDLKWGRREPSESEFDNRKNDIENNNEESIIESFLSSFPLLVKYLTPTIDHAGWYIDRDNGGGVLLIHCFSYYYIVWQALADVATDYYADEFAKKHNGNFFTIDDMAKELARENCSDFELMQAVYYLFKHNPETENFFELHDQLVAACQEERERLTQEAFNQSLIGDFTAQENITIDDVDMMTGTEFEAFIKQYFEKLGYTAAVTKASGDQGIDVIAEKCGIKTGIQAKCYSGAVGNAAVQEAVAGKSFYQCDKVMVITNRYFTDAAIQLAKANDVILWDRDILKEKL